MKYDPPEEKPDVKPAQPGRITESFFLMVSELLQYPWGADALFMAGLVLLASFFVILYYMIAVVLPIMLLAVLLAIINSVLLESNYCERLLKRLRFT